MVAPGTPSAVSRMYQQLDLLDLLEFRTKMVGLIADSF